MLFIYDGYRSHLGIAVLEKLRSAGLIAYTLPSYTSGTTQPLDLSVFTVFNSRFRTSCQKKTIESGAEKLLDEFDVCKILTRADIESFTHQIITSGFRKVGICFLDELRLFAYARSYSVLEPTRITSVDDMMLMLDERQEKRSRDYSRRKRAVFWIFRYLIWSSGDC